jgi:uncharacterized coiled-coil protein SlyX
MRIREITIDRLFGTIGEQKQIINSLERELNYKTYKNKKLQEEIKNLSNDLNHYKKLVEDLTYLDKVLNV